MKWREMAEETNDSAKLRAQRSETAKFRTLFLFFVYVFVFVFWHQLLLASCSLFGEREDEARRESVQ